MKENTAYWKNKFRELLEKHVALQDKLFEEKQSLESKKKSKPSKGTGKNRGK